MKASLIALLPILLLAVDARPAQCTKRPKPTNDAIKPPGNGAQPPATTTTPAPPPITAPAIPSNVLATPETPKPAEPIPEAPKPADPVPETPTSSTPVGRSVPAGMAMNYESKANIPSFGEAKLSWYYSWNLDPLPNTASLEFVPMVWGADAAKKFDGKLPAGTTHVLGFNEPDIGPQYGGSNQQPAPAAQLHQEWTAKVAKGIKIGAPGVARGGAKWLREFNQACGAAGCTYDFVPYHFYGTNAQDLISYTKEFYAEFKKPLWLTEVACHDYSTNTVCTKDETKAFMATVIGFFKGEEGSKMVERYSWFGAFPKHAGTNSNGLLNGDGTANEIGKYYASL